jgi:hypothetical protein
MTREANRARFPEFAALVDATGGKLRFAEDENGAIGSRPVEDCEIEYAPYTRPKGSWNAKGEWK